MRAPQSAVLLLTCLCDNVIAVPAAQANALTSGSRTERNAVPIKFVNNLETADVSSEDLIQELQLVKVAEPGRVALVKKSPDGRELLSSFEIQKRAEAAQQAAQETAPFFPPPGHGALPGSGIPEGVLSHMNAILRGVFDIVDMVPEAIHDFEGPHKNHDKREEAVQQAVQQAIEQASQEAEQLGLPKDLVTGLGKILGGTNLTDISKALPKGLLPKGPIGTIVKAYFDALKTFFSEINDAIKAAKTSFSGLPKLPGIPTIPDTLPSGVPNVIGDLTEGAKNLTKGVGDVVGDVVSDAGKGLGDLTKTIEDLLKGNTGSKGNGDAAKSLEDLLKGRTGNKGNGDAAKSLEDLLKGKTGNKDKKDQKDDKSKKGGKGD
ncbi:hypothetical protein E4U41_001572 [Claviceps citrina]|nr:hypothetical protein E4U41_001572 [Claviceps citrina]